MERRHTSMSRCPNKAFGTKDVFCAECYVNMTQGARYAGHLFGGGSSPHKRTYRLSVFVETLTMKRESQEKQKGSKYIAPTDKFWDKFPNLAMVLCDGWWDDGTPRDCPQLGIRLTSDGVQLSIIDIGLRRSTSTVAPTLFEGLSLVEALCALPRLPWRDWGHARGKGK